MTSLKKSYVFACLLWSVFSLFLIIKVCGETEKTPAALFIFGDSILDAGNNNYFETPLRANFWPYGETFFNYSTGRFTNGRTIPDFISEYAKLPLIKPYLHPGFVNYTYGVNFASSGSGVLPETRQGYVIDLKTQVKYFNNVEKKLRKELGSKEKAKAFISSAVYLFSAGGNDYFYAFEKNPDLFLSQHYLEKYIGMVIGNLTNVIQEIYEKGGRKFGFLNMSPVGCIPALRAIESAEGRQGCAEELSEAAKLHNKALSHTLQNLTYDRLNGIKYSILDFFTSLTLRSDNPSKYGFKEEKSACCGSGPYRGLGTCGRSSGNYELCDDPSEFLYFDNIHPTEKAYEQLTELFWTGRSNMAGPYSLKLLFEMDKESSRFQASF